MNLPQVYCGTIPQEYEVLIPQSKYMVFYHNFTPLTTDQQQKAVVVVWQHHFPLLIEVAAIVLRDCDTFRPLLMHR